MTLQEKLRTLADATQSRGEDHTLRLAADRLDLLDEAGRALEEIAARTFEYIGVTDGMFDPAMDCDVEMKALAEQARSVSERIRGMG